MDIRQIAFDLDGTLLRSDKTISPRTMRALHAAAQRGVLLVPATGRLYRALPETLTDASLFSRMILVNGAQIYDNAAGVTLAREELTPEQARRMLAHLGTLNVVRGIYLDGQGYMSRRDFDTLDQIALSPAAAAVMRRTYLPAEDLDELAGRAPSVQKLMAFFRHLPDRLPAIRSTTERFPEYAVSSSIANNIEINARNATKGAALGTLCRLLGLELSQCMAFGDDTNDCSMLRAAGLGVAMENAAPEVRACADTVTESCDDDGVARMIERVLEL